MRRDSIFDLFLSPCPPHTDRNCNILGGFKTISEALSVILQSNVGVLSILEWSQDFLRLPDLFQTHPNKFQTNFVKFFRINEH